MIYVLTQAFRFLPEFAGGSRTIPWRRKQARSACHSPKWSTTSPKNSSLKRAQVKELFEELSNLAISEVKENGEFVLPGFGKLVLSERKAREGRNPQTGETIQIPAKTTLKFRSEQRHEGFGRAQEVVSTSRASHSSHRYAKRPPAGFGRRTSCLPNFAGGSSFYHCRLCLNDYLSLERLKPYRPRLDHRPTASSQVVTLVKKFFWIFTIISM